MASGGSIAPREWRATKATQICTGVVISGFTVIGEAPYRNKSNQLVWLAECPAAKHRVEVLHAALTYGAPFCTECARRAMLVALGRAETEAEFEQWFERHSIPRNRYAHRAERAPELSDAPELDDGSESEEGNENNE